MDPRVNRLIVMYFAVLSKLECSTIKEGNQAKIHVKECKINFHSVHYYPTETVKSGSHGFVYIFVLSVDRSDKHTII